MSRILLPAVAAYVFVLPTTGITSDLAWHDDQRLAQIALLLLVAVAVLPQWINVSRSVDAPKLGGGVVSGVALSIALILGAISAALAPLPRWAYVEWSVMVLLIVLGLSVAALRQSHGERFDRLFIGVLLLTATAYVLKAVAAYTAALVEGLPLHSWGVLDGFSNPRSFGQFQSMTLPLLALPAMFWARTLLSRIGFALLPAMWWMLAIASGTRGTWLAMAAAGIAVYACARHKSHSWLKWQFFLCLTGLVLYWLVFFLIPGWFSVQGGTVQGDTVNRIFDITNLSFRDVLWKNAFEFATAHPLFGVGPMHFAYYQNSIAAHPHMSLLQWAAEWGVPSALMILGVVLYAGAAYVRQLRDPTAGHGEAYMFRLALLASLCAAAAHSLVDGIIVMPYSQTLLALLCGWTLALYRTHAQVTIRHVPYARHIFAAVVLLSAVLLLWGVIPSVVELVNRSGAFNTSIVHEGKLLMPRFWSNGWIGQ